MCASAAAPDRERTRDTAHQIALSQGQMGLVQMAESRHGTNLTDSNHRLADLLFECKMTHFLSYREFAGNRRCSGIRRAEVQTKICLR
jgi:hypothetical protein